MGGPEDLTRNYEWSAGREKEMEIFIRAMQDAFLSYSKDAEKAWIEAGGRALR